MKEVARYENLEIPSYALCYLVNADASGLEKKDKELIDWYMEQFYQEAAQAGGHVIFACGKGKCGFTHFPEFGLPYYCVECTILIVK
jgi:hypothetical protein